ncbi:MAG: hypothetical protein IKR58_04705 [Lachnospiraceae bacterium]|nr:hypothetical protein [Lachnospiraceae bacterium]
MKKIKQWWTSLDEGRMVNGKLLFFEFVTAILAGILIGIIITPFRSITIASNNSDCGTGNCASAKGLCDLDEDEDEDD